MALGRPTVWEGEKKEEAIKIVMLGILEGNSLRGIFKEQKDNDKLPSRKTFNEWLAEDTGLSARYASCARVREEDMFEECIEIADSRQNDTYKDKEGNVRIDHDVINRDKLRIDTRKYALSKMRPEKYGDRIINENTNKNTEIPQTIEDINDELIELIQKAAKNTKK